MGKYCKRCGINEVQTSVYCITCSTSNVPVGQANNRERISSVVRSNAATGWISVKERLPEKGACVITFEPHCINNPDKGIGVCEVDSDFTDKKSDGNFWITHWMPLPEPPEV